MGGHTRLVEVDCTDEEAARGCRVCDGPIVERHWATLKWAAANWYCSRKCVDVVEAAAKAADRKNGDS